MNLMHQIGANLLIFWIRYLFSIFHQQLAELFILKGFFKFIKFLSGQLKKYHKSVTGNLLCFFSCFGYFTGAFHLQAIAEYTIIFCHLGSTFDVNLTLLKLSIHMFFPLYFSCQ